jgi:hypothetical protein
MYIINLVRSYFAFHLVSETGRTALVFQIHHKNQIIYTFIPVPLRKFSKKQNGITSRHRGATKRWKVHII